MRKNKINIDIEKEKVEFWSMLKGVFSLDTFEFFCSVGLVFFIIIIGTWAIPQIPERLRYLFAVCIPFAGVYVMFHALDKLGLMRDK